jgi:hypothetical protein
MDIRPLQGSQDYGMPARAADPPPNTRPLEGDLFTATETSKLNLMSPSQDLKQGSQAGDSPAPPMGVSAAVLASAVSNAVPAGIALSQPGDQRLQITGTKTASAYDLLPQADKEWLGKNLKPGEDGRELAEFYLKGQKIYNPSDSWTERNLAGSLHAIDRYLSGKEGILPALSREERRECLMPLIDLIPPSPVEGMELINGNTKNALYLLGEAMKEQNTADETWRWGYGIDRQIVSMSPPAHGDLSMPEAAREYAELLSIIKTAKYRAPGKLGASDAPDAYHALRVLRSHFHYDQQKSAEFKELLAIFGDPGTAVGTMTELDKFGEKARSDIRSLLTGPLKEVCANPQRLDPQWPDHARDNVVKTVVAVYSQIEGREDYEDKRKAFETELMSRLLSERSPLEAIKTSFDRAIKETSASGSPDTAVNVEDGYLVIGDIRLQVKN